MGESGVCSMGKTLKVLVSCMYVSYNSSRKNSQIPSYKVDRQLPVASLTPLQEQFKDAHYLVLDEKSMIGWAHLFWIDQRLRRIYPSRSHQPLEVLIFCWLATFTSFHQ